jgi:hypothetical protein
MTYTFIAQRCSDLPVVACCRAMGASTSGFYAWQANPVSGDPAGTEGQADGRHGEHPGPHDAADDQSGGRGQPQGMGLLLVPGGEWLIRARRSTGHIRLLCFRLVGCECHEIRLRAGHRRGAPTLSRDSEGSAR